MFTTNADLPHERFHRLLDSVNVVLWCMDVEWRFTYVSQAVQSLLGYEPEALIGKTIDAVLTPAAAAEARASLDLYYRSIPRPSFVCLELVHRRNDGTEFWGEILALPICDDQGRLVEVQGAMRDITNRKRAEASARENERMLRGILRAVPFGIGITRDRTMIWSNEQMARLTGYLHEDYRGLSARTLFESDLEFLRVSEIIEKGMAETGTGNAGTHIVRKDGSRFDALLLSAPIDPSEPSSDIITTMADISDYKRVEGELRESEKKYRELVESANSIILRMDKSGIITFFNNYASHFFGFPPDEIIGRSVLGTIVPAAESTGRDLAQMIQDIGVHPERYVSNENENMCRDGTRVWVMWTNKPVFDDQGRCVEILCIGNDITKRKRAEAEKEKLETQLRQMQKMEAVGQLAGGIAHDFNNLLQVILGYVDILRGSLSEDALHIEALDSVHQAAERAADLTRQLLAFSRRQVMRPVNLDLNNLIYGVLKMIQRAIGEHVDLRFMPAGNLGTVHVDKGQIEHVLINLCLNARDAMPNGGTLTIKTENAAFDDEYCQDHPWVTGGPYVLLSVTDTGHGMDEATRARIFEPFFTTKDVGKGTGLGLATVYGIVKQHNGSIHVYSEPGKGTVFKVYIPAVQTAAEAVETKQDEAAVGGTETILVAEDEEMVRNLVRGMLRAAGYRVLTASDGEDALRVFEAHAGEIDLALLDVTMPKLNGRDVMERIHTRCPRIRFLFTSGYSANAIHTNFVIKEGFRLITKPYRRAELLRTLRETLDTPFLPSEG